MDNIEVGESVFIRLLWKDKRDVYMMSTIYDNGATEHWEKYRNFT